MNNGQKIIAGILTGVTLILGLTSYGASIYAAEESGSIGIEGKISSPPPTQAATITLPRDGTTTTETPLTVTGLCSGDLLVKIFKNNVFAGSVQCKNGSYTIKIDLFGGRNELVARVFDDLNQKGPDSNKVIVNYPVSQSEAVSKVALSSSFAKRGADPGKTLTWPIILSGGFGPYAITVDWGDGKEADIISQQFAGTFNISHTYDSPGVYTVTVRATDKNKDIAFLQLVGVANGDASQQNENEGDSTASAAIKNKVLWQPTLIAIPLVASAFWLGRKHEIQVLRKKLQNNDN